MSISKWIAGVTLTAAFAVSAGSASFAVGTDGASGTADISTKCAHVADAQRIIDHAQSDLTALRTSLQSMRDRASSAGKDKVVARLDRAIARTDRKLERLATRETRLVDWAADQCAAS